MGALWSRLMALWSGADKARKGRVLAKVSKQTGEDVSEGGFLGWLRENWAISSVSLVPTLVTMADEFGLDIGELLADEATKEDGLFSGVAPDAAQLILNRVLAYTSKQRAEVLGDGDPDTMLGADLGDAAIIGRIKDASDVLARAERLIGGQRSFDALRAALLFDDETIAAARLVNR